MERVFAKVFAMSVPASLVILSVFLIRALMRRAPRRYVVLLWLAVLVRLALPFPLTHSGLSLFNHRLLLALPRLELVTGGAIPALYPESAAIAVNGPMTYVNRASRWVYETFGVRLTAVAAAIWLLGALALLTAGIIGYLRARASVRDAVRLYDNVYESPSVPSPFVLGLFRTRVYLPAGLEPDTVTFVSAHEHSHVRRFDHVLKLLAFLLLCVYWFCPPCWAAFYAFSLDLELRCDESVLNKKMVGQKEYSRTLLAFAAGPKLLTPGRVTFGEPGAAVRIRRALRWKPAQLGISTAALALALLVIYTGVSDPPEYYNGTAMMRDLRRSLRWENGEIAFTIPAWCEQPSLYHIWITGEAGMGAGVAYRYYLRGLSSENGWQAGETYRIPVEKDVNRLYMDLSVTEGQETEYRDVIDLLMLAESLRPAAVDRGNAFNYDDPQTVSAYLDALRRDTAVRTWNELGPQEPLEADSITVRYGRSMYDQGESFWLAELFRTDEDGRTTLRQLLIPERLVGWQP